MKCCWWLWWSFNINNDLDYPGYDHHFLKNKSKKKCQKKNTPFILSLQIFRRFFSIFFSPPSPIKSTPTPPTNYKPQQQKNSKFVTETLLFYVWCTEQANERTFASPSSFYFLQLYLIQLNKKLIKNKK